MDRLKLFEIFIAVTDEMSFVGASRRTGMSTPAVTRAIQLLERHLDTKLFNRSTRAVRPTEAGLRLHADVKRILADIGEAELAVHATRSEPRGQMALTAPVVFGRLHVAPLVAEFLKLHRQVTVRTVLVDRVVNMIEEGIDVAIRIADLPDSSLRATQVGAVRKVVCASPAYLAEHGVPAEPRDLSAMEAIDLSESAPQQQWGFVIAGKNRVIRPPVRMTTNTAEVAVAAAVSGLGVARLMSYQAAAEIQSGALQVVLADFEPEPVPVHVVYLDGARTESRVRPFVIFLVERLRLNPLLR